MWCIIINYKISVIIPVYNAENDISFAIDSIINQTFGFDYIELILVDDASTDLSKEIINQYVEKYDNIKLIELKQNSGLPGKPRSLGIDYATSDYIIFLDSDDTYQKNAFEILYDTIKEENSDFVISSHYINLDGDMVKANLFPTNEQLISFNPLESQEKFDKLSYNHLVAPWGKIFKKNLIINNNISFPDDSLCEDTYFYFKCLINSKKVSILPKNYLYIYNTFEDKKTAIHGHDLEKFNNFLKGMEYTYELLDNVNLSINVFLAENIGSLLLIFSNLDKKEKKEAILKIYDFEKDLDIQIPRKEISILNNLILKKDFKKAIFISNLYSLFYNNILIKNIYRKFNNNKNS
ncbi:glycosyltransferase family 2 protein [Methanobrevibacter millerae]|uniref:Glycosyl transferase GT2 family n=1 Tax=Methanobrevibacter millerae TaxID=230361 RepID=A0A0U3E8M1_9EURY|nr:glycosyltransferase family 2 protein [Methanobrevibacter millerae]ALT69296.1 glycosyl transferase GT2 family [Methanobrevibacter millerae]